MPFPPTCQSPVTCDNRPSRKVGDTWLCLACFEYTEHHNHLPIPEEPMSQTIPDQILAHLKTRPVVTNHELQCALGVTKSSISSALATLRNRGLVAPSDGTGTARLVAPPAESALPDAVPGYPLLWQSPDRQGGAVCVRGTRVDVVTLWANAPAESAAHAYNVTTEQAQAAIDYVNEHPELQPPVPEDTVQTSEVDVLRAEVARLTTTIFDLKAEIQACEASNASCRETLRIWEQTHEHMKQKNEQLTAAYSSLEEENARIESHLRGELEAAINEIAALKHGPAVRLEWSPWEDGYTQLTARFGRLNRQIASIHNGNKVYATIDVSDVREDGDVAINVSGVDMKQITDLLRESLISLAGLTMPPVPTIPESA